MKHNHVSIITDGTLIDRMYNLDSEMADIYLYGNRVAVICEDGRTFIADNYDKAVAKLTRRGYRF